MKFYSFFFLFLLQLIFISCNPKNEKKNSPALPVPITVQPKDTSIAKGIPHPVIFCKKDSLQSYAIYLPNNYLSEKKFPVIYFFDSHSEGVLPIEKYKSLAEKYGYIIAGSNNSKNGLPWETTQKIIQFFFNDVQEKFSIDKKRIYAGGFSGGARVASSIAITNGGIAGVAACGAGFGNQNEQINGKFVFAGIAGNADFNMIELKNLERTLETSSLEHHLIIFDGKHEWCPPEIMEEVFQLFEISAMKNGLTERNDSLVQQYISRKEKEIQQYKNKKQMLELWNLYRKLSVTLYGLTDVSKYKQEIISLENSPALISELNKEIDAEKSEISKQQEYSNAFTTKNLGWWNNEIKSLKKRNSLPAKRLIGYLGLAAYMYSNGALNKNQFQQADNFLKIYTLLEPENSEHEYLYALLFMKTNQPGKALSYLKSAVLLGFKDKERLEKEEIFSPLRNKQGYLEIISKLQ